MARIVCFDYGTKRVGIAVTDTLQMIATPLQTIATKEIFTFISQYVKKEMVSLFLVGYPLSLSEESTDATPFVEKFTQCLKEKFPTIPIEWIDEQYSSKRASIALVEMGMKKKERQKKGNIDLIAATLLLQEYLYTKQGR